MIANCSGLQHTITVYEKGAEVVRMYKNLLGSRGFKKSQSAFFMVHGMDPYFKRHDGQAVTCEDFFAAVQDANGVDFHNFLLRYSCCGYCWTHGQDLFEVILSYTLTLFLLQSRGYFDSRVTAKGTNVNYVKSFDS